MSILGIDLGTGFSCIAVKQGTDIVIIPNAEGGRTTPSVVAFAKNGERLVGQLAKRQAITNPENTIEFIKRKMGTDEKVILDGKTFTPQQISAMILQKLKTDAEAFLGESVKDVVITVPAYFDDRARTATKDAGTIAGLNVVRIINEPTAACLAYGLDTNFEGKILVVDTGCGTTDMSILDVSEGVFEVVGTSGDNYLGGSDWDKVIADWIVSEFKKSDGIDLSNDKMAMQRIMEAAEKAKMELSTMSETQISLPFITADANGPKHLEMKLTRALFESLSTGLMERFRKPLYTVLKDANMTPNDIDKILLVGGSTRMPMIQNAVKDIMGKEPIKGINPDECVATGAAIHAAVINGEQSGIILVDVVPLSLGITTEGAVNTILIEKNTAIPISKKQIFTTAADNQPAVTIEINQGERPLAADNRRLGMFTLDGITPAPRGVPQIEVSFDIDSNGILSVSAVDLGTKKEQHITIQSSNLSDEEIEKYKKEAEIYAEEDNKRKEHITAKNNAESLKYRLQKTIDDNKDNGTFTEEEIGTLNEALSKIDEVLSNNDATTDELKAIVGEVTKMVFPITMKLYSNNSSSDIPDFMNDLFKGANSGSTN